MATSPGNSTTGASSRCTVRHLVDAVCKIRRQKQCATMARIHKAVRQQLQRNVEVEEVLEQLNAATSMGELWRVDNNGVTSYREPPKGTSKEHLKWSVDKHARWPPKDQHNNNQFMMGHMKYPQNEPLTQPVNDHLAQRAAEHLPWAMTDQLRCSTAEPLREHMESSRCSMNDPFISPWPMPEPVRWPTMNDPMTWPATEPLRQSAVEPAQQRCSEPTTWPMNEPFRRPINETLAWPMNQSLRGQMAEQFAWHMTEPLRHPMADPLSWSVTEPLRRPMTEPLSWHSNEQLRRSITEPLGWTVAPPDSFRRPTAEHFNWCATDTLRQTAKDTYAKSSTAKDASLPTRNMNETSSGWPTRDNASAANASATHAASAKALSRSVTNSQKDPFKDTAAPMFACPVSQTAVGGGCAMQNKIRTFSPPTNHNNTNSKFHSVQPPGPCKDGQNSCTELQRTCKDYSSMRKDIQRLPEETLFGGMVNPYQVQVHPNGSLGMMSNNQGSCIRPDGQFGCVGNPSGSVVPNKPRVSRTPALRVNESSTQVMPTLPVAKEHQSQMQRQQHEPSCLGKGTTLEKSDRNEKSFPLEKNLPLTDLLCLNDTSTAGRVPDAVLEVARSLLESSNPGGKSALGADATNTCHDSRSTIATDHQSFLQVDKMNNCASRMQSKPVSMSYLSAEEQRPSCNDTGESIESEEIKHFSPETCLENCMSNNLVAPAVLNSTAENKEINSAYSSLPVTALSDDLVSASVVSDVPITLDHEVPFSDDLTAVQKSLDDVQSLTTFDHQSKHQHLKCPLRRKYQRSLKSKTDPFRKIRLNCSSLAHLAAVLLRSTRVIGAKQHSCTIHNIKNVILSTYDVALSDRLVLAGRIKLACSVAVRAGWLRKKKHSYVPISRCSETLKTAAYDAENKVPKFSSAEMQRTLNNRHADDGHLDDDRLAGNQLADDQVAASSPRLTDPSSIQYSLTDMGQRDMEKSEPVEGATCRQEEPLSELSSMTGSTAPSLDLEVTTQEPDQEPDRCNSGHITSAIVSSEPDKQNEMTSEKLDDVCRNSDIDPDMSEVSTDMNPKGLIDGLTRFFTPSNKRSSRVSRNSLHRALEIKSKNGSSPKTSRLLSQTPQRSQQEQQSKPRVIKAASNPMQFSVQHLDSKDLRYRRSKASSGRRREQLYDGLSHFFAVEGEGKRRSCTLSRFHGNSTMPGDVTCKSAKSNASSLDRMSECSVEGLRSEVEGSELAGRVVRARTRSLSLSGDIDSSTATSLQLCRNGQESKSLSQLNIYGNNVSSVERKQSRTLNSNAYVNSRSASVKASGKSEPPRTHGHTGITQAELSHLGPTMERHIIEHSSVTSDAGHARTSFVPSDSKKTKDLPSHQSHDATEVSGVSHGGSNPSHASSASSDAVASAMLLTNTGKSAMVKLTRLSSEDCSAYMSHSSALPSEESGTTENGSVPDMIQSQNSEDDLQTEQPTVLHTAEARRIVQPGMTPNDIILFRKAQKIAAERILVTQELSNLDPSQPNPPCIQFGAYEITTAHSSLYPAEFASLPKLFICEFCLKYMKSQAILHTHVAKCRQSCPSGNELYRIDNLSVFEVDGDVCPVYCQNLCLLARLFVPSKSPLQSNMSPFLFYVLTRNDETGSHLIGCFAKEKYNSPPMSSSLVSLLVLPPHQRKGYGDFLIRFSYLLCRLNKSTGSPVKPLSPLSTLVFKANWSRTVLECIKTYWTPTQPMTIRDISLRTGIHSADVMATLSSLQLIDGNRQDTGAPLSLDTELIETLVHQLVLPYIDKRIQLDLKALHWTKSSLQHLIKTSIESEKAHQIVRRKSSRKLQQRRKEDELSCASETEAAAAVITKLTSDSQMSDGNWKSGGDTETQDSSKAATKRKSLCSPTRSPTKTARVCGSDCCSPDVKTEAFEDDLKMQRSIDKAQNPSNEATEDDIHESNQTTVQSTNVVAALEDGSGVDDQKSKATGVTGNVQAKGIVDTQKSELRPVEKKIMRSVEVQTDAYESDYSDDDDDSDGSSSGSGSCDNSSCCSSTSSDEAEMEDTDAEKHPSVLKTSAEEAVEMTLQESSTNSVPAESNDGTESDTVVVPKDEAVADDASSLSQVDTLCESLCQGNTNNSPVPVSLHKPVDQPDLCSAKLLNNQNVDTPLQVETGGESSCHSSGADITDSTPCEQPFCDDKVTPDSEISHETIDDAAVKDNFAELLTNAEKESITEQLVHCADKMGVSGQECMNDIYSGAVAVGENFQFGSALPGAAPNLGIESPMSMNSSSEMGSCNVDRTPSQAYSDCAQVQNVYGLENVGASPACGYGMNQMTSPAGSSQITSPISNQSFNITRCSPAMANGPGYGNGMETASSQLPNTAGQLPASGTTFKMPVEDARYAATSSAYPVNGFGGAMASPASMGHCGYAGQYAEQSPGAQCSVVNQNSPNGIGLGYNMPTPSPTNSSSRSFNMASPNTNAYHGQPSGPQVYDRSCPSAPVLSYARVLPQQLHGATDGMPWTHIYSPQATGYSLIKFSEQELVPQHAVTLPRNLLPSQPPVAVQPHLTQVNLVPLNTKPAKCPTTAAPTTTKQHRRCGKSCKSGTSSALSTVRSQTVAPNVTIQPGTNMITSYNVINMNVDYRAQQPPIAAYPSAPYISNAAFINDAQQMPSLNIYQHRAINFPRQPQPHNNVYTAAYGYINGAITQQSFNINVNSIMRQ